MPLRKSLAWILCVAWCWSPSSEAEAEASEQIVVPEVATSGVEPMIATVVTELILEALLNRHGVKALGPSDVKDMLNVEQQKMLMGCDQNSCMAELAGAMGATRVVAGMVGRLGSLFVVTLKLIDTQSAQVVARASRRFERVEQVPEATGPLVDDLLSSKPRAGNTPAAVLEIGKKPKKRPETMQVREFCKRMDRYSEALREKTYDPVRVEERRTLLADLLHTPFLKQFDEKVACVRAKAGWTYTSLRRGFLRSTTEKESDERRRRHLEWLEMTRLLELLVEAYHVGFEKEKNGVGGRPSELPFTVKARTPERPEDSEEVRRFLDDYASAQRVVAKALDAAKKKKKKRFEALWTPEDPKRSRTSPSYKFDNVSGYWKSGYQVDTCPIFLLSAAEIDKRADQYAKEGVLKGCYRRQKDDYVTLDDVRLRNPNGRKWQIDRW